MREAERPVKRRKATLVSGLSSFRLSKFPYGLTITSVALLVTPNVALIVTLLSPPPRLPVRVVITKFADVAPSGTVTVAGTVAFFVSLLRSVTDTPPAGAGPFKVTVPVELAGAVTRAGFRVRFNN